MGTDNRAKGDMRETGKGAKGTDRRQRKVVQNEQKPSTNDR